MGVVGVMGGWGGEKQNVIHFVLYYLNFLDYELTPICFFHKTLMSHFKLLLVKLYILLTPSCFVFPSH